MTEDLEGAEPLNLESARARALSTACGVMSHEVQQGKLCLSCHIEIADDRGNLLLKVPFSEAVKVSG